MNKKIDCFTAYDVRGEIGVTFDSDICYRIGRSFALVLNAKKVILARDARATSLEYSQNVSHGLIDEGVKVLDIGLAGTEEMYWATSQYEACGGIIVTASHNPINYNGLKMVKSGSRPLETVNELAVIKKTAEENLFLKSKIRGTIADISLDARRFYVQKILSFINWAVFYPMKVVINSGNGAAGPTFDAIDEELSKLTNALTFERLHHCPDSDFPNGIPNPLIKKNQAVNTDKIIETNADFGIAFDGDFDRCFFFDETGAFVPGQYIVGLLARVFLEKEPGARIVHDPRAIWNIREIAQQKGGHSIISRTGHAFIKRTMRKNDAVYGGEMSAHHYFRDFAFCDSGMLPWLLIVELMSLTRTPLSKLIEKEKYMFPSSGEVNFELIDPDKAIQKVLDFYKGEVLEIDEIDGLSLCFSNWRLNLRKSNTENLLRLNLESKASERILKEKLAEIETLLGESSN